MCACGYIGRDVPETRGHKEERLDPGNDSGGRLEDPESFDKCTAVHKQLGKQQSRNDNINVEEENPDDGGASDTKNRD